MSELRPTPFQRRRAGDLEAIHVFDDPEAGIFAFLSNKPAAPGHTVVTAYNPEAPLDPTTVTDKWTDVTPRTLAKMMFVGQLIGKRQELVITDDLPPTRNPEARRPLRTVGAIVGYEIAQVHFHTYPSFERSDTGMLWTPNSATPDEMKEVQDVLALPETTEEFVLDCLGRIDRGGSIPNSWNAPDLGGHRESPLVLQPLPFAASAE